jgi:hypothetical protein
VKQLPQNIRSRFKDCLKIIEITENNCPSDYGLNNHCPEEEERCLVCWEQALDEIEVN